jgi:hypothetical protein
MAQIDGVQGSPSGAAAQDQTAFDQAFGQALVSAGMIMFSLNQQSQELAFKQLKDGENERKKGSGA